MKAIVIGGSNGLGLAISVILEKKGYHLEIFDIVAPECGVIDNDSYTFHYCDLGITNFSEIEECSKDGEVNILVITAGIGRIADFQYIHPAEIEKLFRINTLAPIKTISLFYDRLLSEKSFYTVIISSISAFISSPSASVYAATKASVMRFVESINAELEAQNTENRILNVAPGTFEGSRFYGKENDLSLLLPLGNEIVNRLVRRETIYIPRYSDVYSGVISKYRNDPHQFGLDSYEYKLRSGRKKNQCTVKIGYLSGTFDLFHIGHLNLLRNAKTMCDYLIVGVHSSGAWKGKETFIPLEERKQILESCRFVDRVIDSYAEDSDAWCALHYNILFVGSDYYGTERFSRYEQFFKDKGVKIIYLPYTKTTSSTQIRNIIQERYHIDIETK